MRALLIALLLLAPLAAASATEPSNTYPVQVASVRHSNVAPGGELAVEVTIKDGKAVSAVTMYVCEFPSEKVTDPDICYSPPAKAEKAGSMFTVDSAGINHPSWKDGKSIGYKLKVDGEWAPTDHHYYRLVVGEKESDALPVDGEAATPLPFWVPVLALVAALVVRRR